MLRILLLVEDIAQLANLKTILAKLGCVVEDSAVELGLRDKLMAFRPEVVITGGGGKRVNPFTVSQKVRELSLEAKVVLLLSRGGQLTLEQLAENKFDAFIETPFEPLRLLATINDLAPKGKVPDLIEKYVKVTSSSVTSEAQQKFVVLDKNNQPEAKISVFGSRFSSSAVDDKERVKSYKKMTDNINIAPQSTISKKAALSKMGAPAKADNQDELDEAKKQFVKKLFSKK